MPKRDPGGSTERDSVQITRRGAEAVRLPRNVAGQNRDRPGRSPTR